MAKTNRYRNVQKKRKMQNYLIIGSIFVVLAIPIALMVIYSTSNPGAINFSAGIDKNGFWKGVKASNLVELFDYGAMAIPAEIHQITDERVAAEINTLMSDFASESLVTDRAVVYGDTVNIDYVGSIDGVAFEGGNTFGEGADVTIGVTSYIDDFLEQLIGHMPGETFDVEVTFPDEYHEASLAGKEAVFETTINYITDSIVPEFTDDFVLANLAMSYGWLSADEAREAVRQGLHDNAVQGYIMDFCANEVPVSSVPDKVIEHVQNVALGNYQGYANYYGTSIDDFLAANMGVSSTAEFLDVYYDSMVNDARYYLVMQAIAEDAGMKVDENEVREFFLGPDEAAGAGAEDFRSYVQAYGMPYMKKLTLTQKAIQYMTDNATLLDE